MLTAAVVAAGARVAFLVGQHMMSPGALVGAWMMLALVAAYPLARFRPAVGVPVLIGFGAGAAVVAFFAGMEMMG